jgi:hypothetical protein
MAAAMPSNEAQGHIGAALGKPLRRGMFARLFGR